MTIYKKDFIDQLVKEKKYTKRSATALVEDFWSMVIENLENGNPIYFRGMGCFDIVERAARSCPNPNTGERCEVPAHWVPRFYPGTTMKRAVKSWHAAEERGIV